MGLQAHADKWSQVWRNAPQPDLEELIGKVGSPTYICSEDESLYAEKGGVHRSQTIQGSMQSILREQSERVGWVGA